MAVNELSLREIQGIDPQVRQNIVDADDIQTYQDLADADEERLEELGIEWGYRINGVMRRQIEELSGISADTGDTTEEVEAISERIAFYASISEPKKALRETQELVSSLKYLKEEIEGDTGLASMKIEGAA